MATAPASIRRARPLLGTFVEIAVARAPAPATEAAVEAAFAAVARVHRLMSFHDADSDVSRLNRAAAMRAVRVHEWTYRVLEIALDLHGRSRGAFDVTVAPALQRLGLLPGDPPSLVRRRARRATALAWRGASAPSPRLRGEGWGEGALPQAQTRGKGPSPGLSPHAGRGEGRTADSIQLLDNNRIRFAHPKVRIDLGGIAKGFAVDRAVEALRRHGMTEGLVNAGGDLAAFGDADYTIDIRDPRRPDRAICRIALSSAAVASSAMRIDPRYGADASASAVIDPATGMPAQAVLGATVCAPCCVVADALTKVVMNAGEHAAPVLDHYGASALLVKANGESLATSGCSIRRAA
jgi:thiamine biosynthesis lipoprotein